MADPSGPKRTAAVLGRPIEHSLSPVLHRAGYAALGLAWDYTAIDCGPAELAGVLAEHSDYAGFSATMPLKYELLQVAASVSEVAVAIGAANTLLPTAAGWRAENTDWIGIRDALAAAGVPAAGDVLVLGAGGTAQAALAALITANSITAAVRDPGRARGLLAAGERLGLVVRLVSLADLPAADLVISTLPPGAADPVAVPAAPAVLDVVYAGWPTALARRAAGTGAVVVSGAAMLLYQAARQFELMTGRAAPVAAMQAAMRAAVPAGGL